MGNVQLDPNTGKPVPAPVETVKPKPKPKEKDDVKVTRPKN